MTNVQNRLLTTTALAATIVCFMNLPAEAQNPELGSESPVEKRNTTAAVTPGEFVIIEDTSALSTTINGSDALQNIGRKNKVTARPGLSQEEKINRLHLAGDHNLNPEDVQALKDRALNTKFEPLVYDNNGTLEFSDTFHKITDVTLLANHYSYCVVKGNVQLAGQALTQLEKLGCKQIGTFSALEGKHLDFCDIAGAVFYNSAENTYFVIWHGTASNEEGWQTNMDNTLITADQIKRSMMEIMRDQIVTILRDEKGIFRAGQEDAQLTELMKEVKENLTTDMSINQLIQFRDSLKSSVSAKVPKLANKTASSKEVSLLEKIDRIFAVKMEMLGKKDFVVKEVKAATVTALSNKVSQLDQVLIGVQDTKIKAQFTEARSALNGLIQHVRVDLPHCKTAEEVENFISNLRSKLDTALSGKKSLLPKVFRKKGLLDLLKTELNAEMDIILSERHEQLKRLGKAYEINFNGKVHRGYALKVASAGHEIEDIINHHVNKLDEDLRQRARVVITGHSMAGALAKIHAATFKDSYTKIFGQLPTAANNRLLVHALSAAPTGDHTFRKSIEGSLGLGNIVDQKVAEDIVPKADPQSFTPDSLKQVAALVPWAGKELAYKMDTEYALQIGTPALDRVENVHNRIEKHFPGKAPAWWQPMKSLVHNKVAAPHYGINLRDKQPEGEGYGREDHYEMALVNPESIEGWNALLAYGGQKATDAFLVKPIVLKSSC